MVDSRPRQPCPIRLWVRPSVVAAVWMAMKSNGTARMTFARRSGKRLRIVTKASSPRRSGRFFSQTAREDRSWLLMLSDGTFSESYEAVAAKSKGKPLATDFISDVHECSQMRSSPWDLSRTAVALGHRFASGMTGYPYRSLPRPPRGAFGPRGLEFVRKGEIRGFEYAEGFARLSVLARDANIGSLLQRRQE